MSGERVFLSLKAPLLADNAVPRSNQFFKCGLCHEEVPMFDDDDDGYPPELDDDPMPAGADADAMIAAMQEAEDRHAVFLCDSGREDEPVDGGMPAWFYKILYLDEP